MKSYSYISVYYSSDQLISDIGARKSLVIQQFITSKSFRPSIYRFYKNESSIFKAECYTAVKTFKDYPNSLKQFEIICEQVREEERLLTESLKENMSKRPPMPAGL